MPDQAWHKHYGWGSLNHGAAPRISSVKVAGSIVSFIWQPNNPILPGGDEGGGDMAFCEA